MLTSTVDTMTTSTPDQKLFEVLLVDDHDLFASAMSNLLTTHDFASSVHIATTATAALEYLVLSTCDLVLCDVGLPDLSGLDLLRSIKDKNASTRVCMLSGATGLQSIAVALELGADGYLLKTALLDEFLGSLRSVMSGRLVLDAESSRAVLNMRNAPKEDRLLSVRQVEILEMVAQGWSSNDMATELGLAVDTVRKAIKQVHQRLGVRSGPEAVAAGFRLGLLR